MQIQVIEICQKRVQFDIVDVAALDRVREVGILAAEILPVMGTPAFCKICEQSIYLFQQLAFHIMQYYMRQLQNALTKHPTLGEGGGWRRLCGPSLHHSGSSDG